MSRRPQLYHPKKGDKSALVRHGPGAPKIIVKMKPSKIDIRTAENSDSQGSLAMIENQENRLFLTSRRPVLGEYIDVKVVNHLVKRKEKEKEKEKNDASSEEKLDEDELIKMLPELEPAEASSPGVMKNIKMKVVHSYANGDLLLAYHRRSLSGENEKDVLVHARLPYHYLDNLEQINTRSLSDVRLSEQGTEESLHKSSSSWEDEYTMRLSGFSEARSKHAANLEAKRMELESVRSGLLNRLKSLGSERKQMAKQRDQWLNKRSKTMEKIEGLNQEILGQKKLLQESKEAIDAQNLQLKAMQKSAAPTIEKAAEPVE